MRAIVIAVVAAMFFVGPIRADDAGVAVIKKAIEAHGGADNLRKARSIRGTASGTMYQDGASITGEIEYVCHLPDYERVTTQITGSPTKVVGIIAKEQLWVRCGDQFVELSSDERAEKRAGLQRAFVCTLLPLLSDKAYTVSFVGEQAVGAAKATAVRVQRQKEFETTLYFDNTSGLLVKAEYQGFVGQKRVKKELFYRDYKAIDGVMRSMTVDLYGDGKLLMKYNVREEKIGQDIKDSEFAKP